MSVTTDRTRRVPRPVKGLTAAQDAAVLVASVFLLLGVLGFVPGITSGYDALKPGPNSGAALFGVFAVSVALNLIHVAFGLVGLLLARTFWRAKAYLFIGGVLTLGLFGYGLAVHTNPQANVLTLDASDNWLHLGMGVVMLLLALTLAGVKTPAGMTPVVDP